MVTVKAMLDDVEFEIIEEGNGDHVFLRDDGESFFGLCSFSDQKIYLHKELSKDIKRRTLQHELTHAFLYIRALRAESYDEETLCEIVSSIADEVSRIGNNYFKPKQERGWVSPC